MRASENMPELEGLRPFDSCVTFLPGFPWHLSAAKLVEILDRYRVAEALVHDNHARLTYPRERANHHLLEAIKGEPRLHPVWVVEPPRQPGKEAAAAVVAEMFAAGVRAARFPLKRIPPMPWHWHDLCAALEEHRVPCFLDFGADNTTGSPTDTDVNGVRELALAHPQLPFILSHVMGGLGVHPAVLPLMHRAGNLYLDTAGILEYWRDAARELGPERVIFATGMPFTDPGILISNVQYARDLDQDAKRLIYGDNLRRLLEAVQ